LGECLWKAKRIMSRWDWGLIFNAGVWWRKGLCKVRFLAAIGGGRGFRKGGEGT
jgi:hypothetical protein